MIKIKKYLTKLGEENRVEAKIKIIQSLQNTEIAKAEENLITVQYALDSLEGENLEPSEFLLKYKELREDLKQAQYNLEQEKEVHKELFETE